MTLSASPRPLNPAEPNVAVVSVGQRHRAKPLDQTARVVRRVRRVRRIRLR